MGKKTVELPPHVDKETGEVTTAQVIGEGPAVDAIEAAVKASTWERQGRPVMETLSVRLTDAERLQLGDELAGVQDQIGNQLSREESIKKELKAKMAGLEARRDELASIVRRKEQMRPVECVWERNYGDGLARKIRLDTGEVIQSRPLQDHERQPKLLPDVEKKAEGAAVVHSEAK